MKKLNRWTVLVAVTGCLVPLILLRHISSSGRFQLPDNVRDSSEEMNYTGQMIHPTDTEPHQNGSFEHMKELSAKKDVATYNLSAGQHPYLFWVPLQRFGNLMFQYSGAYCMAVTTNHTPTIPANSDLIKVFRDITGHTTKHSQSIQRARKYKLFPGAKLRERYCCKYDEDTLEWVRSNPQEVLISGYRESFKYFSPCWNSLKQQYTFREHIRQQAFTRTVIMAESHFIKKQAWQDAMAFSNSYKNHKDLILPRRFTYIGVHVRRTDKRKMYAPLSFFDKAIMYYRKRYERPVFLVCSDDITWCHKNLASRYQFADLVFISDDSVSPFVDFAVLGSCDHSIITAGTFGWWTAWLAGGEVVYYNAYGKIKNRIGWQYQQEDYYPPQWKYFS